MAVNDVFKLELVHQLPNSTRPASTGLHYRMTTEISPLGGSLLCQELIDTWESAAKTAYRAALATTITLDTIRCYGISDPTAYNEQAIAQAGTLSVGTSELVPLRSSPVITLKTELRGKNYRGRNYMMPVPETQQFNGVMIGAYATLVGTYYTAALTLTAASGNVYKATIYSPTLTGEGPIVDNLITLFIVNGILGGQRRRQKVV